MSGQLSDGLRPTGLPPRLPRIAPGLRIGLYGGSFNPAHAGHRHVSLMGLRRLRLDRIWWLVTPGNPLKDAAELAPMGERLAAAGALASHPRIDVTGLEAAIGARFTVETLAYLRHRHPQVRFVWIMGADSLANLHRWRGWQDIAGLVPMAIVDRPGWTNRAVRSRAAQALARYRVDEAAAPLLANLKPPAWVFLHGPRSFLSSSELRRRRELSPRPAVENGAPSALSWRGSVPEMLVKRVET